MNSLMYSRKSTKDLPSIGDRRLIVKKKLLFFKVYVIEEYIDEKFSVKCQTIDPIGNIKNTYGIGTQTSWKEIVRSNNLSKLEKYLTD